MAIIDSKLAEETFRQAREYAQRNDTATAGVASQDWQQPPPAYEEASGSSQNAPQSRNASDGVVDANATGEVEEADQSEQSDENTPLLSRRRRQFLKKSQRARRKIKKGLLFISISLLLACIALLLFDITGLLDKDDFVSRSVWCIFEAKTDKILLHLKSWPDPPESDGVPIEDPKWSPGVRTDADLWPNKDTPLYSSTTSFSFDAFKALYLRERNNGGIRSGQVIVGSAGEESDQDWKEMNGGIFFDRVYVEVEARYSEVALLKGTRVNKMQMGHDKEGVGIYGSPPTHSSKNWYISFHVVIALPTQRQRTKPGIFKDGSSFVSELDTDVDTLRLSFEALQGYPNPKDEITFGKLNTSQMNSGLDIVYGMKAIHGVDFRLQNGQVRDIASPTNTFTIISPYIHVEVVNGHIWLNKLIAKDDIILKTTSGGINITEIAIAENIRVKHSSGITGGRYRAKNVEIISRQGGTNIDIDLGPNLYEPGIEWNLEPGSQLGNGVEALERCQRRNVQVFTDIGEIVVHYKNMILALD